MTRRANWILGLLLAACVARLWLMELPSSFWLDEMATVFVARYGPHHWSLLEVAPQAWKSAYYHLPRAAARLLGESEIAYRLPSILVMGLALLLVARLAARLIHPQAAWFAVFACLALKGINYEAADARPYALGMCVAAASLLFLVRWLDADRWFDGALFVLCAGLLWRVHLLFWPVYLVLAGYATLRVARRRDRLRTLVLFLLAGVSLIPVLRDALSLLHEAEAHTFAAPPTVREFVASLKLPLVAGSGIGAWLLARCFHWQRSAKFEMPSLALAGGWWLCQPVVLFGVSRLTSASVFVPRYLSISLAGVALAATFAVACFIPAERLKPLAGVLGLGALVWLGQWNHIWPPHHNSDWREAARAVNRLALDQTPVLCPSPFLEAAPPVWRPGYPLPGFLYCHLDVYRIRGKCYLLPFRGSPLQELPRTGRFLVYGWEPQVHFWRDWLAARPELAGWRMRRLGPFADVDTVLFERR